MVNRFLPLNETVNGLTIFTALPGKISRIEVAGPLVMSFVYLIMLGLPASSSEKIRHVIDCGGIVYEKEDPERIFVKVKSAVYDDAVSQLMAKVNIVFIIFITVYFTYELNLLQRIVVFFEYAKKADTYNKPGEVFWIHPENQASIPLLYSRALSKAAYSVHWIYR